MTDPTEVPSAETRTLIEEAIAAAEQAEPDLERFIEAGKRAVAAFDAEVNPLKLRDMPYERMVTDSRLGSCSDSVSAWRRSLPSSRSGRHEAPPRTRTGRLR